MSFFNEETHEEFKARILADAKRDSEEGKKYAKQKAEEAKVKTQEMMEKSREKNRKQMEDQNKQIVSSVKKMYGIPESYYRSPEYLKIVDEFFDITHNETRKILMNVNEADQNQVLSSLTHKLYDNIVERVDDIDYGTIPNTKGDITKLENYPKLVQCIETITQLLQEYKQDTSKNIDIVSEALKNIVDRKKLFERAFAYKVELPMIMYSTISLAVISSVSFIITSSIEFIKAPNQDTFDVELDRVALIKTKENLLFTNLQKFNESCRKGQFDSGMEFIIKNNIKNLTGAEVGLVVGGLALVGILLNILPIMRELIFFFYYSRVRVSDYFDIQADLLQMNAHALSYNTEKDLDEKKRIVAKQIKIVEMFRKIANKLSINNKQSEVNATKEIVNNTKKYKTDEVLDSVPDSATSALF